MNVAVLGSSGQIGAYLTDYLRKKGHFVREFDIVNSYHEDMTHIPNPFLRNVIMDSECTEPLNIGSEEMVTINQLVDIAAEIAGKKITKDHVDGPLGVRGRNSNNDLIREKLGWDYEMTLEEGMKKTYEWVRWQVSKQIYSVV